MRRGGSAIASIAVTRLGLAVAFAVLAGCFSDRPATGPEPPVSGPAVAIDNFAFVPPDLSVPTGTTVTWTNKDALGHTVSSDDDTTFDSSALAQGTTPSSSRPANPARTPISVGFTRS